MEINPETPTRKYVPYAVESNYLFVLLGTPSHL